MPVALRQRTRQGLLQLTVAVGVVALIAVAVAPFTGLVGGAAAAGLLGLGLIIGLLVLSARDGCAVLTLVVVLLLLIPQPYVLVGPLKSLGNPSVLVALGALAIWAASRVLGLSQAQELHPVRWVLLVFTIASAAGFAAGLMRDLTSGESSSMDRTVFQHLALLGVALLAVDELGTRERITTLLERVVLIGGVTGFIGILEFALTSNVDVGSQSRSGFDRVAVGASHPIEFSVVTSALVPLALHFLIHAESRRWRFALALVALLASIPMAVSRSGFITLAVGVVVYAAALSHRGRLNALVLGMIGLAVFRAMVPGLLGTVRSLFRDVGTDPSIAGRTDDYAAIPDLMRGHWWWGRGLGTFEPDVYFILDNQYLAAMLQGGLVGLAAFVILLVIGIGVARGVRRRATDPAMASLGQALTATISALAVSAFVFDSLSFRQSGFLLFLSIGCAGALWSLVRHVPKIQHRPPEGTEPDEAPPADAEPARTEERWLSPVS
jgi:O-antigen ligase